MYGNGLFNFIIMVPLQSCFSVHCTCVHVHVHMYMYMYICMYLCVHFLIIWFNIHTVYMYIHVCTCTSQTCTCTHMYKLQFYIIIHLWDHWLHSGRPRRTSEILVQGKEHEWADVNKKYLVQCRYCGGFLQGEVIDFKCTYTFVHVRTCMCANLLIVFISMIRVS